jgi:hypothetical protein
MLLLLAPIAPRPLNSVLLLRRLLNSCERGFANGGTPGLGRNPFSEVNDGPGQEDPDSLTRCLLDNAYEVWVESDKLNLHIIHRIRSFPSDPCHSNGFQVIKKIKYLQDMQR